MCSCVERGVVIRAKNPIEIFTFLIHLDLWNGVSETGVNYIAGMHNIYKLPSCTRFAV